MNDSETFHDLLIKRFKNNPFIAMLLILVAVVVGLGSLFSSIKEINEFVFKSDSIKNESNKTLPIKEATISIEPKSLQKTKDEIIDKQTQIKEVSDNKDKKIVPPEKYIEPKPDEINIKEEKIYKRVEKFPEFSGGIKQMYEFISQNIKYPKNAQRANVSGKIFIGFIVEKDGSISKIQILKGLGFGCDEEAIRVIKSMPKWNPAFDKGNIVRAYYTMPISFILE